MPSNSWFDSKFFEKELVTEHHVVDHVFEVRTGLIMHAPSSIYEFKSTFFHKLVDLLLDFISLSPVPHGKEFHLDISEFSLRVSLKFLNDSAQNEVNIRVLIKHIRTRVVSINSLQPANIVVSMGNQVYEQLLVLILSFDEGSCVLPTFCLIENCLVGLPIWVANHY